MAAPWTPVDPLGDALHALRMSGVFYCRSEFTTPFCLALPPMADCLLFHLVTAGECRLEMAGASARRLAPGDLVIVPHGRGHRLASGPGLRPAKLFDLPRELVSERYEILRLGGGGAPASVICGAIRFDHPAARQLVHLLPRVLDLDVAASADRVWMRGTLRLMAHEARALRPGGEAVITRLADLLVIQAIRAWIARDPAAQRGWLGALQDPQLGRAVAAVHRDATRAWTLEGLAAEAGMSRSAFAARFAARVGEPPMHYVTRWRMHAALSWLREEGETVAAIADRLGYESEAAFSRAFKRVIGQAPGAARRRA